MSGRLPLRRYGGKEMRRKQKRARNIAALVLIIVAVAALVAYFGYHALLSGMVGKFHHTNLDQSKVMVNDLDSETEQTLENYTTIALFGLDNRKQGNYSRGNSDVIMIMAINNDTNEMEMLSVYRDSYLNIQGTQKTFHKANSAYAYGGAEQAISMLNTNLDLKIDSYVTFDFKTVADAIDAVGGVEIKIQGEDELKWLNKYIDHTNGILGTKAKHVSGTGKHTLNGVQAVAYGRIRYTSGSDYKRAERHRLVVSQLLKKVRHMGPLKLHNLTETVFPQVQTDLTEKEASALLRGMMHYSLKESGGFPFEKASRNLYGSVGWVDVPCDLTTNVTELHQFLYSQKNYQPTETVQSFNNQIINSTGLNRNSAEKDRFEGADSFDDDGGVTNNED